MKECQSVCVFLCAAAACICECVQKCSTWYVHKTCTNLILTLQTADIPHYHATAASLTQTFMFALINSVHPSIILTAFPLKGHACAGAYSSCLWASGGVHRGEVVSLLQG